MAISLSLGFQPLTTLCQESPPQISVKPEGGVSRPSGRRLNEETQAEHLTTHPPR